MFLISLSLESFFLVVSEILNCVQFQSQQTDIILSLVVTSADGTVKIVKNVVVPTQPVVSGKNTLTSLLTSSNKIAGRRILMTKGPDGTTRVVTGTPTSGIVTKPVSNTQQSLIKLQTTGSSTVQQVVTPIKQQIIQQQGKWLFFIFDESG